MFTQQPTPKGTSHRPESQKLTVWNWTASKRSLEQAHVFIWAAKDFLWFRAWSHYAVGCFGLAALLLQLFQLAIDVNELVFEIDNGTGFIKEALEEMFLTLAMLFWLISNTWWAIGECKSLRETAIFDDEYEIMTKQSEGIILLAIGLCSVYFACGMKNSEAVGIRRDSHIIHEHLKTPNLWEPELFSHDKETPCPEYSSNNVLRCSREPPLSSAAVFMALDRASLLVNIPSSASPLDSEDAEENEDTNFRLHRRRSTLETVVESKRYIEEVFMFFWILKDLTWMLEWKWCWLSTVVLILVCLGVIAQDLKQGELTNLTGNGIFGTLLVLWVSSNIIWAGGEMFFTEKIRGIPSGHVKSDLNIEIPPLFTLPTNLTTCWVLRWIGSWVVLIGLVLTLLDVIRHSIWKSSATRNSSLAKLKRLSQSVPNSSAKPLLSP